MYDLVIIGAGPAGLTASIYASCFGLQHVVVGKIIGGQLTYAPDILNYPGFEEISGAELTERMMNQAKKRGGEIVMDMVYEITRAESGFRLKTQGGKEFDTRTIILASGVERRKLNVPGEIEYTNKGIQYCATCGRFDYLQTVAAVVGGANAACQTAAQVAHSAKKVYIVYRASELRCDEVWKKHMVEHPNIETVYNANVVEILGDGQKLTKIKISIKDPATSNLLTKELAIDRLFIEVGGVPGTALLISLGVKMDPGGFISVDEKLSTNVAGVFAAGDVVGHRYSIEQITSAVGSGARAASYVFSFLKQQTAPTLWGSSQIRRG